MPEYIERDKVLSHKWDVRVYDPNDPDPVTEVVSVSTIIRIPAADVVEVRHAHWIVKDGCAYCSDCRNNFKKAIMTHSKFCPMCGAKMDGWQDK